MATANSGFKEGKFRVMRGQGGNANRFSSPLDYNKSFYGFSCAGDVS